MCVQTRISISAKPHQGSETQLEQNCNFTLEMPQTQTNEYRFLLSVQESGIQTEGTGATRPGWLPPPLFSLRAWDWGQVIFLVLKNCVTFTAEVTYDMAHGLSALITHFRNDHDEDIQALVLKKIVSSLYHNTISGVSVLEGSLILFCHGSTYGIVNGSHPQITTRNTPLNLSISKNISLKLTSKLLFLQNASVWDSSHHSQITVRSAFHLLLYLNPSQLSTVSLCFSLSFLTELLEQSL